MPCVRLIPRYIIRYLFHHMRCGILVVIRDKKLVVFAPFANKDYTNDWDGA